MDEKEFIVDLDTKGRVTIPKDICGHRHPPGMRRRPHHPLAPRRGHEYDAQRNTQEPKKSAFLFTRQKRSVIISVLTLFFLLIMSNFASSQSTEEQCISTCASFYQCSWENGQCIKRLKQEPRSDENSLTWTASACCKFIPPPELERSTETLCLPVPNENNKFPDKDSCQAYLDRKISECEQIADFFGANFNVNVYTNIVSAECSGPPETTPPTQDGAEEVEAGGDNIPAIPEWDINAISKLSKDPNAENLADAIIQSNGLSAEQANELRENILSWKALIGEGAAGEAIKIDPPKELSNGPSMVAISSRPLDDSSVSMTYIDDLPTIALFRESFGTQGFPIEEAPPKKYDDRAYFSVDSKGTTFEDVWFSYNLKADPEIEPSKIKILRWDEESGLWVKQPTYTEKRGNLFKVNAKPDHTSYFAIAIEKQSPITPFILFWIPIVATWIMIVYLDLKYGSDKSFCSGIKSAKSFGERIGVLLQIKFSKFVLTLGMLYLGGALAVVFIAASFVKFGYSKALDPSGILIYGILGLLFGLFVSLVTRALIWITYKLLKR